MSGGRDAPDASRRELLRSARRGPDRFPIDPDVDEVEDARHHRGAPAAPPTRWPRFRGDVLLVIAAGGCIGGLVRYQVTDHWTTASAAFPWPTFAVNVAGAFVLALLVVLVTDVLPPSRYLRPLVGTGFCGALTTFSSVVVAADELLAHGHVRVAVVYIVASIGCGLVAALFGLATGRGVAAWRQR